MKIVEYDEYYIEEVRDLLVELEEYIVSIDKDNLDIVGRDYREKMILHDLRLIKENNGKMYLAILNNKVIGMIAGYIVSYDNLDYLDYKCPKKGRIIELIVTKKVRSNGVGRSLMEKMEQYFKDSNCEYVSLEVFNYNENAISFYNKLGYHTRMQNMIKKIDD